MKAHGEKEVLWPAVYPSRKFPVLSSLVPPMHPLCAVVATTGLEGAAGSKPAHSSAGGGGGLCVNVAATVSSLEGATKQSCDPDGSGSGRQDAGPLANCQPGSASRVN